MSVVKFKVGNLYQRTVTWPTGLFSVSTDLRMVRSLNIGDIILVISEPLPVSDHSTVLLEDGTVATALLLGSSWIELKK